MKVLIVDDSVRMRNVIVQTVATLGCEIRECDNGRDAISQYREWLPDWVVMDVRMPVLDGLTSTGMIRAEFPAARIILISVEGDSELRQAAIAAGAQSFLPKSQLVELAGIITSSGA